MKRNNISRLLTVSLSVSLIAGSLLLPSPISPPNTAFAQVEAPVSAAASDSAAIKVTLLSMERFGPATLVEAGSERLLFDAGRGAALRLSQMSIMPGSIDKLFLTHLHSDHTIGIPDVWLTGSLPTAGKRSTPFKVWGPTGTKEMMANLEQAFEDDIQGRIENQNEKLDGLTAVGQDITQGIVYETNGVQVVAFLVDHSPMEPSFGYRVNYKGHSVVLSGDTRYNENLIRYAKGTDLLIHEVAAAQPEDQSPAIQKILSKHTTPEEAGKVFQQVQPKLAVFSHIVLLGGLSDADANLAVRTSKAYNGKLVVGEDLMSFTIGDQVTVKEPHVGLVP